MKDANYSFVTELLRVKLLRKAGVFGEFGIHKQDVLKCYKSFTDNRECVEAVSYTHLDVYKRQEVTVT